MSSEPPLKRKKKTYSSNAIDSADLAEFLNANLEIKQALKVMRKDGKALRIEIEEIKKTSRIDSNRMADSIQNITIRFEARFKESAEDSKKALEEITKTFKEALEKQSKNNLEQMKVLIIQAVFTKLWNYVVIAFYGIITYGIGWIAYHFSLGKHFP